MMVGVTRRLGRVATAVLTASGMLLATPAGAGAQTVTTFAEVATAVGINFTHDAGTICDPPITSGSAWADYDGDGDPDLFLTNRGGADAMYENQGDTSGDGLPDFTNEAAAIGIDAPGQASLATVFVDYDNDGDQDLFVAAFDANVLWRNDGDTDSDGNPNFTDVTATAGIADFGRTNTASWGDYDNDGFLDLYLAKHIRCVMVSPEDAEDHLFHNNGDGTFTDVTDFLCGGLPAPCADTEGLGFVGGFVDYDNDGDADIYLVNDNIQATHEPNKLWRNDGSDGAGGWIFTEVGAAADADISLNGMGLGIGDYNNDGFFDFAFSDTDPGRLLENDGDGTFTDVSAASGVVSATVGEVTWGTVFFDYNNDMWEDLYFVAGEIQPGGNPNVLVENNHDGTFTDISVASGLDDNNTGRNASIIDFDGDGFVDVMLNNYTGPATLYRNQAGDEGNTNGFITVTVEGTESNRDGIGTRLELTAGGVTQTRQISSGPTHGGGDYRAAYFGLGAEASGTLEVHWPNGVVENIGTVSAGTVLHLVEPLAGAAGDVTVHVFDDLDGNGIEDAGETGISGVSVSGVDSLGGNVFGTTDANGDATLSNLATGTATVTVTAPSGFSATTGNEVQMVTVVDASTVAADPVGYQAIPTGDIAGHVFGDADGNGLEDGGDAGLAGVQVDATDFSGAMYSTTTDANGDFSLVGLSTGDATVTFTTPTNHTLTTGNDVQVVTVVDSTVQSTADVGYQPLGTPPTINGIDNADTTIDQGATKSFRVDVSDYVDGGTWTFSGSGLTVNSATVGQTGKVRLNVTASSTATPGVRDLTVTNPDGLSDTLVDAVEVIGTAPPPTGEVAGHVFEDLDGNGVEDAGEVGLANVTVTVTDSANDITIWVTDANGDFTATGVATGTASVDFSTPAGHALTTGNGSQQVTVADSSVVNTVDVGYQPVPSGDVAGFVFADDDGNGVLDAGESGLAGVMVDVTDFNGSTFSTTTDTNGDFTVTGAAVGDATVTFATPSGHTLTTGNDLQVVTVVDTSTVSTADVGYQPPVGTPPTINSISGNTVISQGATRSLRVDVSDYVSGATWTFSGTGVTVSASQQGAGTNVRITVVVDAAAATGPYDLTVTNPDGLSDTLVGAIEVTASTTALGPR